MARTPDHLVLFLGAIFDSSKRASPSWNLPTSRATLFGVRIERERELPSSIRRDRKNITVGRFFRRDGEECADPAVDLEVGKNGLWYPIHVHLADDYRSCIDGPLLVDFEERQKQVRFCARWSADLMNQGYDSGDVSDLWGQNI